MAKSKFTIISENENWVAVNKPAGMLTIPDRKQSEKSLKEMLIDKYGAIFTVHRLDRDTSGIVIFAKNEDAHRYLSVLFEERRVDKYYLGIVQGIPPAMEGEIEAPIAEHLVQKGVMTIHRNGKPSKTGYKVLQAHSAYSLVEFRLYTGRTHQIRVHCKNIGNPLACDEIYGNGEPIYISKVKKNYKLSLSEDEERPMISRLALHAYKISFTGMQGESILLEAEPPKEFNALLKQLAKA